MHLKRYEAADMAEALAQIKRDLGPDAIILSTRKIRKRGGIFKPAGQSLFEVMAAADPQREGQVPGARVSGARLQRAPDALHAEPVIPTSGLEALSEEIRAMRWELRTLRETMHREPIPAPARTHGLPASLVALYQQLVSHGVAEDVAYRLLEEAQASRPTHTLVEEAELRDALTQVIAEKLQVLEPRAAHATPRVMAFVGPTGVGKTTTIAKLAAAYALTERKQVALLTLDTYRIAAVEQLKVYGKILGAPVTVATDREELSRALREAQGVDVVLIDTAGRCHRNAGQMWELKTLMAEPGPVETHLVLSATTREEETEEIISQFSLIPLHSLLFTKLDESGALGSLLNLAVRTGKPLSYLTTGQRVPEDIEVATSERIVDIVLHGLWR